MEKMRRRRGTAEREQKTGKGYEKKLSVGEDNRVLNKQGAGPLPEMALKKKTPCLRVRLPGDDGGVARFILKLNLVA